MGADGELVWCSWKRVPPTMGGKIEEEAMKALWRGWYLGNTGLLLTFDGFIRKEKAKEEPDRWGA